jgi:hypothetical protein
MKQMKTKPRRSGILVYSQKKASQATINRHYKAWRDKQDIPDRCDNPVCCFHNEQRVWNDRPLPLILDHVNGNRHDNRPDNLRYLCPNCDSQLDTRGGANKGRVKRSENGFVITSRDGRKAYTYFGSVVLRRRPAALVEFVPPGS